MQVFDGRVAVVTGGAAGIGRAMADAFARLDMKLVLADVDGPELERAADELRAAGADVRTVVLDVADRAAFAEFADEAFEAFGAVHVLCNNAGVGRGAPMAEMELADWDWSLGVNLGGVIHGIHFFLRRMIAQDVPCHIVNTASIAGLITSPGMAAYSAAKAGVVAISETLAAEMEQSETRVGVSVLCPAWVRTRIHDSERLVRGRTGLAPISDESEAMIEQIGELIRAGMDPAHVADLVVDAIRCERLHILTHPDFMPLVEGRFRTILDAGNE